MGKKFILIDLRKREEARALDDLVRKLIADMDSWIADYGSDDATPPNNEECADLEAKKIEALLSRYDLEAATLKRVKDSHSVKRQALDLKLDSRKGRLYQKFRGTVENLEEQATMCMKFCVDTLKEYEASLKERFPINDGSILKEISACMLGAEQYINVVFPEGVVGLDKYDDTLPDGLPSYAAFKDMVIEKQGELMELNKAAIPNEIEKIKKDSRIRFRNSINDAIKEAIKDMENELFEEKLPFLTESEMDSLRSELIAYVKEYGESRLDDTTTSSSTSSSSGNDDGAADDQEYEIVEE